MNNLPKNRMRPIHPGEILREDYINSEGVSATSLAKSLAVPTNRVTAIINETRGLTADTALRLARHFGTTPQYWMNMQQTYELRLAEIAAGKEIDRKVKPADSVYP
jgi:addiction module HigA family antidote